MIIIAIWATAFAVYAAFHFFAVEGWQDDAGFHFGKHDRDEDE